jgi:type IV pilus assembly protein PilV
MMIFSLNNKGFTLLELMVAMVILMVGMLGLLSTINISIQQTAQDQLRELAIGVGEEQMRTMLAIPFGGTFSNNTTPVRPYRNAMVPFTVGRTSAALGSDSLEFTITVGWKHKGVNQQHQLKTVRSR